MDRRIRILLADGNEEFCGRLKQVLEKTGKFVVAGAAADGERACALLQTCHPDILALDLMLPKADGITVLKQARELDPPPLALVMTGFMTEYIGMMAAELGVQYFMRKPCACQAVAERIAELASCGQTVLQRRTETDVSSLVTAALRELGVPAHIRGYQYLRVAITIAVDDMDVINAITKGLYPQVAEACGTTPPRVERVIRHAIGETWKRGDAEAIRRFFGSTVFGRTGRPSNLEFIALAADRLRMQMQNMGHSAV